MGRSPCCPFYIPNQSWWGCRGGFASKAVPRPAGRIGNRRPTIRYAHKRKEGGSEKSRVPSPGAVSRLSLEIPSR